MSAGKQAQIRGIKFPEGNVQRVLRILLALLFFALLGGLALLYSENIGFWIAPDIARARHEKRREIARRDLEEIASALKEFHKGNGVFPRELTELVNLLSSPAVIKNPETGDYYRYVVTESIAQVTFLGVDNAVGGVGLNEDIILNVQNGDADR